MGKPDTVPNMEKFSYEEGANFQFDSKAYLKRFGGPHGTRGTDVQFLDCWHSFYQEHGKEFDPSKALMLEFGGGPTLWSLISAAPYVSSITFAEFAETNRAEIQQWKNNDPGCHNWKPYIEYIVESVEKNTDPNAADLREQEMRRKIRDIVFCDIKSDKPLGDIQQKFDIISTSCCVEIVFDDKESYINAFSKFRQYLKPKGYILSFTSLEGSWYLCHKDGDTKIHQLSVNSEDLDIAFKRAGFTIIHSHIIHPKTANVLSATKKWRFIVARNDNTE